MKGIDTGHEKAPNHRLNQFVTSEYRHLIGAWHSSFLVLTRNDMHQFDFAGDFLRPITAVCCLGNRLLGRNGYIVAGGPLGYFKLANFSP